MSNLPLPSVDYEAVANTSSPGSPRHPMQEDINSLPLYLNPVLEPLVLCLARGLFRHFKTADEIFALEPTPEEPHYELLLRAPNAPLFDDEPDATPSEPDAPARDVKRPEATRTPFYDEVSRSGTTGEILNATWFSKGFSCLSRRSGYETITIHDIRAEALITADGK